MNHFFDVGANIGQTFDDFLNKTNDFDGWQVWCFEPSFRHLSKLSEKISEQSQRYKISMCPFGLRGSTELSQFYLKDDPRGDSFEHYLESDHVVYNMDSGYGLIVPAIGIGDFILKYTDDGDRIVVKLDCEGSEYDLLTGLLRDKEALSRVSGIFVEWHKINLGSALPAQTLAEAYEKAGIKFERWMF